MEAVNDLFERENLANVTTSTGHTVSLEDVFPNEQVHDKCTSAAAEDSVCQGETRNQQKRRGNKKRKVDAGYEGIFELLSKMHEDNNERLKNLTSTIGLVMRSTFAKQGRRCSIFWGVYMGCRLTTSSMRERYSLEKLSDWTSSWDCPTMQDLRMFYVLCGRSVILELQI